MNEEGTQQNCEKWALELEQIGKIWNAKDITIIEIVHKI
jgi:hypothetical protein